MRCVRCRYDAENAVAEEVEEEGRTVAGRLAAHLREAVDSTDAVAVAEERIDAAGLSYVSGGARYWCRDASQIRRTLGISCLFGRCCSVA